MSPLRLFARAFPVFFLFLAPSLALAQVDVNIEQGLKPYGSYMGGNIDTVSTSTGNLMLHIPLVSYPQRGGRLKLAFFLRYNNKGFHIRQWTFTNGLGQQQTASRWVWDGVGVDVARDQVWEFRSARSQFSAPQSGETTNATFFLTLNSAISPDGSSHILSGSKSTFQTFGGGILDGSGLGRFGILDTVDGNTIYTSPCPANNSTNWHPLVSLDPNGNQITTTLTGWTDTLGRQIPGEPFCISDAALTTGGAGAISGIPASSFSTSFTNNGVTSGFNMRIAPGVATTDLTSCPVNTTKARIWNLPAFNNSTAIIKFCYAPFQIATNFAVPSVPEVQGSFTLLQNVILPNGTMWTFNYNSYGDLTFVGFPTGGSISYTWTTIQLTGGAKSRTITSRSVNANDGAGPHTWNYVWTPATFTSTGITPVKLVLTDPTGNDSVHTSDTLGYEQQAQYFQGSSANNANLLKTVQTTYQLLGNPFDEYTGSASAIEFPTSITTTWANGQSSQVTRAYDTPTTYTFLDFLCLDCASQPSASTQSRINGQLTIESLFDYGNTTTPIRSTSTTYFSLDDPSTVITSDGNGNKCAETDFAYDDPNRLAASGVTQQHGVPYAGAVRANLSSTTRWLTTTPCSPSASWSQITSYSNFNDTGTLASTQDPLGNVTSYAYSPTFYGAYVTQTTLPTTNSVAHVVTGDYDFSTGLLKTFTDQNSHPSAYTYDSLQRLTAANFPDGGQTTFCYTDVGGPTCSAGAPPFKVVSTKKITSTSNLVTTSVFDGLGRTVQVQLNSDPDCASGDLTDTTYDALGRVLSVSNPYCTTGDPTYGITTYTYDALGRTTQVTHPDGSSVLTTYTGRATQAQDEGNGTQRVSRISQVDGLGRLTSVCEVASGPFVGAGGASSSSLIGQNGTPAGCGQDIAGTGFLTTYQFDALGNLLQVNQGTMAPRTFAYDSLSRLTSATNPESGTITYGYDANGNLLTKTGPRQNQTNPAVTVTTTYQYDALNRLTQRSYSDGTTPTASFFYDKDPAGRSYTNLIGRLFESNVPSATGCISTFQQYDSVGRISQQWQNTPVSCGNYAFPYTYDLMGNMTSSWAPYEEVYTYAYNTAGRLTAMTGSQNDAFVPGNLLTGIHYNAAGQITSDTLGDGETESFSYTHRNQLQSRTSTLNSSTVHSFNLTLAPNGNVLSANDTVNGNWTYNYDPFNRLVGATQNSGGVGGSGATPVLVQSTSSDCGSVSFCSLAFASNNTSGNFIVVAVRVGSASAAVTVNDSLGNAYNLVASQAAGTDHTTYLYDAVNIRPGANTITVSLSAASTIRFAIHEYSGLATSSPLDAFSTAMGTGTSLSSGNLTTTQANELVFAVGSTADPLNWTAGAGFTLRQNPANKIATEDRIVSSPQTLAGNFTVDLSDGWAALAASFKPARASYSYVYDRFGNRWQQSGPNSFLATFTGNNPSTPANNNRIDGLSYDAAGNLLSDLNHTYFYDAENRLIQVGGTLGNCSTAAACYFYDADGRRVHRTGFTNDTCDATGIRDYIYDLDGHWVVENNGNSTACNFEIYAGSRHLGSIYGEALFDHTDWLGTSRLRLTYRLYNGFHLATNCTSLPFGDAATCAGGEVSSPLVFTSKERDSESGLDNFGARYYASSSGRFATPDWSAAPTNVPYANFADPQSLNLYNYVQNNPLNSIDPTGHCTVEKKKYSAWWCFKHWAGWVETEKEKGAREKREAERAEFLRRHPEIIQQALWMTVGLGTMIAFEAANIGGGDGETTVTSGESTAAEAGTAESGWVRVGRWMSKEELAEMEASGTAVESETLGSSRVALPASPDAYKGARSGSVYVEYDVPAGSVKASSAGQGRIPGPNSPEARLAAQQGKPTPTMPPVKNIKVVKTN